MKHKITYFLYNTRNNGGNRVIFEHANRLSRKGIHVYLITIFGKQPHWFPLEVTVFPFWKTFFRKNDILVGTFWPTAYLCLFLQANKKFHFIQAWEPDFYRNFFLKFLVIFSLYLPFKKITISSFLKKRIQSYSKNPIYKLLGNGLDFNQIDSVSAKRKNGIKIVSVISWYQWYKGIDILVKIIKQLKVMHPEYRWILISNEKKPYDTVFDEFYTNPSFKRIIKAYKEATFFLATSRSEGFLIPALEAMASNCLVVTTDSGGVNEYIKNGVNGIIVDIPQKIVTDDIFGKLLRNKHLQNKLLANAHNTAREYTWDRIIFQLEKIYLSKNIRPL